MTYALLTRMPVLDKSNPRLACVRHAASVRPEPGSNSPLYYLTNLLIFYISSSLLYFTLGIKAVIFHELIHGFLQPVQELTEYTYFICCTLFYLDSNNLSLLPMSLFLDNCVLCFQCTSLEDFVNSRDKKNAI